MRRDRDGGNGYALEGPYCRDCGQFINRDSEKTRQLVGLPGWVIKAHFLAFLPVTHPMWGRMWGRERGGRQKPPF